MLVNSGSVQVRSDFSYFNHFVQIHAFVSSGIMPKARTLCMINLRVAYNNYFRRITGLSKQ